MDNIYNNLSGWLVASGTLLSSIAPSGTLCWRTVHLNSGQAYDTGHVSMNGGSFKKPGESGNWYGDSPATRDAEAAASGDATYEVWKLQQDTPILDARCIPKFYLNDIEADRDLVKPDRYTISWQALDLIEAVAPYFERSGVSLSSRRTHGTVYVFNPKIVPMKLLYSGEVSPTFVGCDAEGMLDKSLFESVK